MKYLIKLEDRETGSSALVECPSNMTLENLDVEIKLALNLPYVDHGIHAFLMQGKVYVPGRWAIRELWGDYYDWILPRQDEIEHRINYPLMRDIRDSGRYRLRQVFTVKGSVIVYNQTTSTQWNTVWCTLVNRMG